MRTPVHLGRAPDEQPDEQIEQLWSRLLPLADAEEIRSGSWRTLEVAGWPDKQSCANLAAWRWDDHLVVVNYSDVRSDGRVLLDEHADGWTLVDVLDGASYERDGGDLYVALEPYAAHLFRIERA